MSYPRFDITPGQRCAWSGCKRQAMVIACGRHLWSDSSMGHPEPDGYCEEHASEVADERYPEYIEDCPNCGCRFGVN